VALQATPGGTELRDKVWVVALDELIQKTLFGPVARVTDAAARRLPGLNNPWRFHAHPPLHLTGEAVIMGAGARGDAAPLWPVYPEIGVAASGGDDCPCSSQVSSRPTTFLPATWPQARLSQTTNRNLCFGPAFECEFEIIGETASQPD
jgi:hypothetical protein